MTPPVISLGSRGSPLALAQARLVQDALAREGWTSRVVVIRTDGDRRSPDTAWGEGAFVAALERALLHGRVDIAVHSAKDIPTQEDPQLGIAAYLPRADPRDALVVRPDATERRLADLPAGARVGTDSPRRTGFLLAHRPDLHVHPLHGNVDTRLRRLDAGETDALVIACAGLDRLGIWERIAERLDPELVPPAPGQAAIAIQVRRNDAPMRDRVAAIDDRSTRLAVEAERAFLMESGGGCRAPIGALAVVAGDDLDLLGAFADRGGAEAIVTHRQGLASHGPELGQELARELRGRMPRARSGADPAAERREVRPRVLVTRPTEHAGPIVSALRDVCIEPVLVPTIAVDLEPGGGELDVAARHVAVYAWVVITSRNGARAFIKAAERVFTPFEASRFAAIGPATSEALELDGIDVEFQPRQNTSAALAAELPMLPGQRILVVQGDLAGGELAATLRARGARVNDVIAYRTREAPERSRRALRAAVDGGPIAAALFTSGSTVRGLVTLGDGEALPVRQWPAICIGPETAEAAEAAGFVILAVSAIPDATALATITADALMPRPVGGRT